MKRILIFLIVSVLFALVSCENAFEDVEKKDTDEAIYYQALVELNKRNYDGAIFLFESLSPAVKASRPIAADYASAYSARCGLDFLGLIAILENIASSSTIYAFLFDAYPGGTDARIADCVQAETILNGAGDYTIRNSEENILMAFSSLVKIGTILDRYADTDDDDVIDGGFDHCDPTDFPDDAVREIGTGTANAILSGVASGSDVSPAALQDISDFCSLDPELNVFCTTTDKTTYTANQVRVLRSALGSSDFGIGACSGDLVACGCP